MGSPLLCHRNDAGLAARRGAAWRRTLGAIVHKPASVQDGDGSLTPQEQLLLEEYRNAAQLTYHVDGLRDRLSVFFVTVTGIAAAGLSIVLKDEPSELAV